MHYTKVQSCDYLKFSIYAFWISNKVKEFMGREWKNYLLSFYLEVIQGIIIWFLNNTYHAFHGQWNIFLILKLQGTVSLQNDWEL